MQILTDSRDVLLYFFYKHENSNGFERFPKLSVLSVAKLLLPEKSVRTVTVYRTVNEKCVIKYVTPTPFPLVNSSGDGTTHLDKRPI